MSIKIQLLILPLCTSTPYDNHLCHTVEISIKTNPCEPKRPRLEDAWNKMCDCLVPPSVHTALKGQGPPWQTLSSGFTVPKEGGKKDKPKGKLIIKGGGAGALILRTLKKKN
jgi:hypothetical protein